MTPPIHVGLAQHHKNRPGAWSLTGGLLEPLDFDEFSFCESCLEGKMTKRPFNAKGRKAQELLD